MHWYYKPTHSPRYPGSYLSKDTFLTDLAAKGTLRPVGSASSRPLGRSKTTLGTPKQCPEDYQQWLSHMSRPTISSGYRRGFPKLSFAYENRTVSQNGRYVWEKMSYFNDVHNCMWSRHGDIRPGCKLRGQPKLLSASWN